MSGRSAVLVRRIRSFCGVLSLGGPIVLALGCLSVFLSASPAKSYSLLTDYRFVFELQSFSDSIIAENVARAITLGEYGSVKWGNPVVVRLDIDTNFPPDQREVLRSESTKLISIVSNLTSLPIDFVDGDARADLIISMGASPNSRSLESVRRLVNRPKGQGIESFRLGWLPGFTQKDRKEISSGVLVPAMPALWQNYCAGELYFEKKTGSIKGALILLNSSKYLSLVDLLECTQTRILEVFGVVFWYRDFDVGRYVPRSLYLRVLYDNRVKSGLSAESLLETVAAVVSDMRLQFKSRQK